MDKIKQLIKDKANRDTKYEEDLLNIYLILKGSPLESLQEIKKIPEELEKYGEPADEYYASMIMWLTDILIEEEKEKLNV